MEKRTHSIRFRLGSTLLWDTSTISFSDLKHMKYNLILNKFLVLFLEKYRVWYCVHYYTIFSSQPFLFFFFFYLKNYTNKRIKLFRIGSIFRKFITKTKKRQKAKIALNFNLSVFKTSSKGLKYSFWFLQSLLKNSKNFSGFNIVFIALVLKSYLNEITGIIRKKNPYLISRDTGFKKNHRISFQKKQKVYFLNRFISVYLRYFYKFIFKSIYRNNMNLSVVLFNLSKRAEKGFNSLDKSNSLIALEYLTSLTRLIGAKKFSVSVKKPNKTLNCLKKGFFFTFYVASNIFTNFVTLSLANKVYFFKFFFFFNSIKYLFWKKLYSSNSVVFRSRAFFSNSVLGKNFITPVSFYTSFTYPTATKKVLPPLITTPVVEYKLQVKKNNLVGTYRRWLTIKLFQLQLSLNLGLLLSKSISVHLINSFRITPKLFQPKTFRILNAAICRRYFIKNIRDRSFILNFLNLFFLGSYFKFINALVRFLASELVVRRRMNQLKFINLLKKILISEFFDQFLSKLQILGFYILITGKIGRKPRTQTMSILKKFRSVQTSQVKISYSCKKSITFFGVLSVKFWLYYV